MQLRFLFIQYINRYALIYIIFRYFCDLAPNKVAVYFYLRGFCCSNSAAAISHNRDISRFKLPVINSKRGYDGGREGSTGRKGGYQ